MSGKKLRDQCVTCPEKTVLVTCFGRTQLLCHAFATVWEFDGGMSTIYLYTHSEYLSPTGIIGWITQLVIDRSMRRCYVATQLLQTLKTHPLFNNVTVVGLVSSHPAACDVLAKYAGKHSICVSLNN